MSASIPPGTPADPLTDLHLRKYQQALSACLTAELAIFAIPSPRQRLLMMARYQEGKSWQEIAGLLAVSESTAYALHRKALAWLEASRLLQEGTGAGRPASDA